MTNSSNIRLFSTALLLSSLQFGFAQPQVTTPTFSFGTNNTPVWDLSGTYQITNHLEGAKLRPMDIAFQDLFMDLDAHGHLRGAGTTLAPVGGDLVAGDYKISGSVSVVGTKTRANFSLHFRGNGIVANVLTTCSISARYSLEVVPTNLTLVGTSSGSARFSNLGSASFRSDNILLPLPPGTDGGWNLMLDVFQYGTRIKGTSVVQVNNSPVSTLATRVTGSLSQADQANVRLSGTGHSAGTALNGQIRFIYDGDTLTGVQLLSLQGKVLGQKVNY